MVLELPKNNVPQILQEMETVRNLHGIRCGSTCGLCILAATIPAHYFDIRMLPSQWAKASGLLSGKTSTSV
jgi:hypothetical protein